MINSLLLREEILINIKVYVVAENAKNIDISSATIKLLNLYNIVFRIFKKLVGRFKNLVSPVR